MAVGAFDPNMQERFGPGENQPGQNPEEEYDPVGEVNKQIREGFAKYDGTYKREIKRRDYESAQRIENLKGWGMTGVKAAMVPVVAGVAAGVALGEEPAEVWEFSKNIAGGVWEKIQGKGTLFDPEANGIFDIPHTVGRALNLTTSGGHVSMPLDAKEYSGGPVYDSISWVFDHILKIDPATATQNAKDITRAIGQFFVSIFGQDNILARHTLYSNPGAWAAPVLGTLALIGVYKGGQYLWRKYKGSRRAYERQATNTYKEQLRKLENKLIEKDKDEELAALRRVNEKKLIKEHKKNLLS